MKANAIEGLKKRKYGLLAALLTACAAVVIFSLSGRLIGGGYTFMRGDLTGQYMPCIRQFLNSLLSGLFFLCLHGDADDGNLCLLLS